MKAEKPRQTILVSGAGGFLGSELIKQLLKNGKFNVIAYTSQKEQLMNRFKKNTNLTCFNIEDWKDDIIPFDKVDTLINCAFARTSNGKELASSLDFTNEFMSDATKKNVGGIINISSQSVYSQQRDLAAIEETSVIPESLYGLTKYSTELLISNICKYANVPYTNLRLASLVGQDFDVRLTNRFIKSAINGEIIKIVGGKQIISYMDVRDAADGLIALISVDPKNWKSIYNFGVDESYKLTEMAELVKKIAPQFISNEVKIEVEEGNDFLNLSMDCSEFYEDTLWKPKYGMEIIIKDIFEHLIRNN